MIFQAAMPCSDRSKRRRDSQSAWASGGARIGNGAFRRRQAAEEGRRGGQMGRNAPMGAWTDAFAQNLRVTESDGCFPLFTPCRDKCLLPAAGTLSMKETCPAQGHSLCPIRSDPRPPGRLVCLRARSARAEATGRRTNHCPNVCMPRRTQTATHAGAHKFLPTIEAQHDSATPRLGHRAGGSFLTSRRKHPAQNIREPHRSSFSDFPEATDKSTACLRRVGGLWPRDRSSKVSGSRCVRIVFSLSEQRQRGHDAAP